MEQRTNIYGSPTAGSSVAEDSSSSTPPNSPNRESGEGSVAVLRPFGQALSVRKIRISYCFSYQARPVNPSFPYLFYNDIHSTLLLSSTG